MNRPSPTLSSPPANTGEATPTLPVVGRQMQALLVELAAYARLDETVLLRGETGTGKTKLAEWVHARSRRAAGPFIHANLLSVPDSGQEAALFGVESGAFTDVRAQRGFIRSAEGGTLFIDEVDKLGLPLQAKLLRFLDSRVYQPLGEAQERRANLRLIVASNRSLPEAVAAGRFLEDLYHRVNVLSVTLPPLRERLDELPAWAAWFLREGATAGAPAPWLSEDAERLLCARPWPGNLRELHNVMRRVLALASGEVDAAQLRRALDPAPSGAGVTPPTVVEEEDERAILLDAARRLVRLRLRRGPPEPGVRDVGKLLNALVLIEAVERAGSLRAGFAALGLEGRVDKGNAARDLARARGGGKKDAVTRLCGSIFNQIKQNNFEYLKKYPERLSIFGQR
ncbi:MAG: sigma-54-dependent Fis family transcriptional regulator [Deltaproteobacteria bacterium]|nr:sigma-54-dependent Fis family transcriptional regulator [Deltaproteobacteria bacterium]